MLAYTGLICLRVRRGQLKLNNYTQSVIILMIFAMLIGINEGCVCIAAFFNPTGGAAQFYFANCGLGLEMIAGLHNLLMYYSMLLIAFQYTVVARQIDNIVTTGTIISNKSMKNMRHALICFSLFVGLLFLIMVPLNIVLRLKTDNNYTVT